MAKLHDAGKNRILKILFGAQSVDTKLYMGLYKNISELIAVDTMTAIEEQTGRGYVRQTLNLSGWTVVNNIASYGSVLFQATGAWDEVTGYFITTTLSGPGGVLIGSEHFVTPMSVISGRGIIVAPKFTLT